MDASTIIKRITIEPAGLNLGGPTSIMSVEREDGTFFKHAVSAGTGDHRPLTLSDVLLALHRHTDALQRFEALKPETTLRAKSAVIVAEVQNDNPTRAGERHFMGEITMEDGTKLPKGVSMGAEMVKSRTTEQLRAFAQKRVQEFADRLTLDSVTRKWAVDGVEYLP